jgi:hypothetical protein
MKSNIVSQFRRHRGGQGWCVSDKYHAYFVDRFNSAVVLDVRFNHQAPDMACIGGYHSTGEASGVIETRDMPVTMPPEAVVSLDIIYDREHRRFHVVDQIENIVDAADFLVVHADGKAQAGWKADSKCAPEWLAANLAT